MKHRENNLTQFFTEYLSHRSDITGLNASNITMACFGALNDVDANLNMVEVLFDMRNDFEYILKVLDNLARSFVSYGDKQQRKPKEGMDYLTIAEIASIYKISQQAIRKACNENRLQFKDGKGKNKYLISKADIEMYMLSAKGKRKSN